MLRDMIYTPSLFNFIYQRDRDEYVIYNTFSKALVILSNEEFEQYHKNAIVDFQTRKTLVENGILIDKDVDEISFLKYFHYKNKFLKDTLFLTIAPTLDCNFACPYCYENHRMGKMSIDVQEALMNYIISCIEDGTRKIDVSWYGGEPLLYLDVFESLAREIKRIAEEKHVILNMHMVTNGYLLTKDIVRLLDQIGITKVQITIDGLEEHHDVRRPLKCGGGTYIKIMKNLQFFNEVPIAVIIRMNVDKANAQDFQLLKAKIAELKNPNISVYPSPVENINKDTVNEISQFMTEEEFESFAVKNCGETRGDQSGFSVLDNRCFFCTAEIENCYVVDELGNFYKCWDEVGREKYKCFNLLDMENINYNNISKYLTSDPFSDPQCQSCVFLPLCFGGCKFQRMRMGKCRCGFTSKTVKKYIELVFFSSKDSI